MRKVAYRRLSINGGRKLVVFFAILFLTTKYYIYLLPFCFCSKIFQKVNCDLIGATNILRATTKDLIGFRLNEF